MAALWDGVDLGRSYEWLMKESMASRWVISGWLKGPFAEFGWFDFKCVCVLMMTRLVGAIIFKSIMHKYSLVYLNQ